MNLDSLPEAVQRLIAKSGLSDRVVGVATIRGDSADQEAVDRFLLPMKENLLLSHYTSWERLEEALGRCSFCMKRVDQSSGDDQSGTFPAANLHSTSAMDEELHNQLRIKEDKTAKISSHEVLRRKAFEHCWFEGWKECPRMWHDYGWKGTGVCIQTRSFSLRGAAYQTSLQFDITLGGCFYRNEDEPIPTIIVNMPLFCKRRRFTIDNEIRLIAEINEGMPERNIEELEWIPLRSMDFIERLVLGPKMPTEIAAIVRAKAKQILPKVAVLDPMTAASEID